MNVTIDVVKEALELASQLLTESKELEKLPFSNANFDKQQTTRKMALEAGNTAVKTAKAYGMNLEIKKMPANIAKELGFRLQIIEIGKTAFVSKI